MIALDAQREVKKALTNIDQSALTSQGRRLLPRQVTGVGFNLVTARAHRGCLKLFVYSVFPHRLIYLSQTTDGERREEERRESERAREREREKRDRKRERSDALLAQKRCVCVCVCVCMCVRVCMCACVHPRRARADSLNTLD